MSALDIDTKVEELMKIKDKAEFVRQLGDLAAILIADNYPDVAQFLETIRKTPRGEVSLTVRTFDGKIQTAVHGALTKNTY